MFAWRVRFRQMVQEVRLRPFYAAFLGLSLVEPLLLARIPLLATFGPFRALLDCAIFAPIATAVGAEAYLQKGERTEGASILLAWQRALLGLGFMLLSTVIVSNWVGWCDPEYGLTFYFYGPFVSLLLASVTGVLWAQRWSRVTTRFGRVLWSAILVPVATYVYAFIRFYTSPAIFSFGHFFGYFPGTLYDTDVQLEAHHHSFRLLTVIWLTVITLAAARGAFANQRPLRRILIIATLTIALVCETQSDKWHWSASSASIQKSLGAEAIGEHCRVIVPREMPTENRARFLRECNFRVHEARHRLGLPQNGPRVTAYLFRNAEEKRLWMGASHTDIAKPWRHELFVEMNGEPHPVLFHEIVHIVLADIGRGPFRVATTDRFGLIPNGAIIEGLAVAIAWENRDGLTTHQWARAMMELHLLPEVSDLLGIRFTAVRASRAYVAGGSFVRFVLETRGTAAVRRLYQNTSMEAALGSSREEVEADWHRFLRAQPLPRYAMPLAEARFLGQGVLSAVCPHQVAALDDELQQQTRARDVTAALHSCACILEIDPSRSDIRAQELLLRVDRGDADVGAELLAAPQSQLPRHWVARVMEELGDQAARNGDLDSSLHWYRQMLTQPIGRDLLRQARAKIWTQSQDADVAHAFSDILASVRREQDDVLMGARIAHLAESDDPTVALFANYLLAKQLLPRGFYREALATLLSVDEHGGWREAYLNLPDIEFVVEADRMFAVALSISATTRRREDEAFLERALLRTRIAGEQGVAIEIADSLARVRNLPATSVAMREVGTPQHTSSSPVPATTTLPSNAP